MIRITKKFRLGRYRQDLLGAGVEYRAAIGQNLNILVDQFVGRKANYMKVTASEDREVENSSFHSGVNQITSGIGMFYQENRRKNEQ